MSQIKWGTYLLPPEAASEHFLFLGSTGSGKSVLIKMLMRSAFHTEAMRLGTRGVVYDAKQDILPFLYHAAPPERIQLLHPFDKRGFAWDIAKDVTSPLAARQIATILIPEPVQTTGADQFFIEASRELVMAAMVALMQGGKAGNWTLRDLLLLTLNLSDLSQALAKTGLHLTERIRKSYLEEADVRLKSNILATLSSKMGVYEPVAAAWERNSKRLSIHDWVQSGNILVLGNDETARASLDPINRALFQRISEEILNLPEQRSVDTRYGRMRTWVILDEFREAGKLEGLRRLLNKGRSKGACVVLGCQDVEGVRAVYGTEEGNELLAQCLHTVVLNIANPATAEWAVNLFGTEDTFVDTSGTNIGNNYSESQSRSIERKTLVATRELLSMPRLNPQNGMSGYFKSPVVETAAALAGYSQYQRICPWRFGDRREFCWEKVAPWLTTAQGVLAFEPKDQRDQYLHSWTAQERKALGLDVNIKREPPNPEATSNVREQKKKKDAPRPIERWLPPSNTSSGREQNLKADPPRSDDVAATRAETEKKKVMPPRSVIRKDAQ